MTAICRVVARGVPLPGDDIDTDRMVPARFLRGTTFEGLEAHVFADDRQSEARAGRVHPFDEHAHRGAGVLVTGANFGCGSSREHAPWALVGWGFQAIVAPSFADIFRQNALKNALVPAAIPADAHAALVAALTADPQMVVAVDIEALTVTWTGGAAKFPMDPFARRCLLMGVDELGYLLSFVEAIEAHERRK